MYIYLGRAYEIHLKKISKINEDFERRKNRMTN